MRFKDKIKGLDPKMLVDAAERLDSGDVTTGCCLAIYRACDRRDVWRDYANILEELFKPNTNKMFWFGSTQASGNGNWRANLQHRILSLLLLADMIRYARK